MGRALLILCAAVLLAACGSNGHEPVVVAAADGAGASIDGHAALPCAACHNGEMADERRAAVPGESCTTSGCHSDHGPVVVSTATASFPHRDHGNGSDVALSCAGCHTHDDGGERLTVSVDACALCHLTNLDSGSADDCRLCHQQPSHVAVTSQLLDVPHSTLPWVETGCTRCHYDVAEPAVRVERVRCMNCHASDTTVIARGVGTDLHPDHVAVNCTSCHEGEAHRVRAMSSAVNLVCADCHTTAHTLDFAADPVGTAVCNDCHVRVHMPQQQLMLGLLPNETGAPSSKFMAGITCRSCHASDAAALANGNASRGHAGSCVGCHPSEYGRVLQWWVDGTRTRTRLATAYLERAQRELGTAGADSVTALVRDASDLVALVNAAGGQHNIELSDRMLRTSIDRITNAYRRAGRSVPEPPQLGSAAHQGTCSFCHYSALESWDFRRMSGPFHRSVLGLDR